MGVTIMTVSELISRNNFLTAIIALYELSGRDDIAELILNNKTAIINYSTIKYDGLSVWKSLDNMVDSDIAHIAYLDMGHAFERVYDALIAEYDPLENYFTDRTESTEHGGAITKTGDKTTTPSGSTSNKANGTVNHGYTSHGSKHQGTTYDAYSDSDFKNISRDVMDGTVQDSYNNYGTTTEFNNYKVEEKYNDITETDTRTEEIEEHRKGNSGIFSKQDLTSREIQLRIKNKILPIFVRLIVDVFNTGVYSSDC